MAEHNLLGEKGEALARAYLVQEKYKIRDTNWRYKKKELDIVAEKEGLLVIVEVKTRTSKYFEHPKEAVTKAKQRLIINATEAYINEYDLNYEVRFDIVAITFLKGKYELEHIKDAFQPSLL